MQILAPAKINLTLAITAKRADGYHELETVMQKIDLCDRLTLEKVRCGVSLQCHCAGDEESVASSLPEDERNIAFKAAIAFFDRSGLAGGIAIGLEKNIPIAAGLGGGSSDGAAVLRGLNQLYGRPLSEVDLLDIALTLGADVPFFVADHGAVFASGIGEVLLPIIPLKECWVLLVNPGFLVSTKWAYENFALTSRLNPYTLGADLSLFSEAIWLTGIAQSLKTHGVTHLFNDLEMVTMANFPELEEIKKTLVRDGASFSMMSGSGPTMFGLFADQEKAVACHKKFKGRYSDVFLCRPCRSS